MIVGGITVNQAMLNCFAISITWVRGLQIKLRHLIYWAECVALYCTGKFILNGCFCAIFLRLHLIASYDKNTINDEMVVSMKNFLRSHRRMLHGHGMPCFQKKNEK